MNNVYETFGRLVLIFLFIGSVNALIIYDTSSSAVTDLFWNITGSKYMINASDILDVNETVLNSSIESFGYGVGNGSSSPQWDTINGVITSNNSISGGNVNVTGRLITSNSLNTSLIFKHNDKNPQIEIRSLDSVDNKGLLEFNSNHTKGRFTVQLMANAGNPFSSLNLYTDASKLFSFQFRNSSDSSYSGVALMYNNDKGIALMPNSDSNDYILFQTISDIPHISGIGGEDIYFYDVAGTNWNTLHADAFTEHTNVYKGNDTQAIEDLEQWVLGLHPDGFKNLRTIVNETCIENECIVHNTYEVLQDGTDLGKSGKALVKYARTNRIEGKRIRDRQYELIKNLYDNGFLTQAQAVNLRDNF